MRIVADTNLLISSIFWNGPPYKIILLALDKKIDIFISEFILNEVRNVLKNPKEGFCLTEQEIEDIIRVILSYVKIVKPREIKEIVMRDPKDDNILACGLTAKADFIITRDKDLLDLKEYVKIKIITPEQFLNNNLYISRF